MAFSCDETSKTSVDIIELVSRRSTLLVPCGMENEMNDDTVEQRARDLLERIGVPDAQDYTSGDLVELANLLNKPKDGGSAFGKLIRFGEAAVTEEGMSLRDWFAGQALVGVMIANPARADEMSRIEMNIAQICYSTADAMLRVRGQGER